MAISKWWTERIGVNGVGEGVGGYFRKGHSESKGVEVGPLFP